MATSEATLLSEGPKPSLRQRAAFALRWFFIICVLTFYFTVGPFGYICFALFSLIPSRNPQARARLLQAIQRNAFRAMHACLSWTYLMRFKNQVGALDKPCVIVANHPTLTDVTAIIATFKEVVTVVKPRLYNTWWLHPLLKASFQIEGETGKFLAGGKVVAQSVERIEQGFSVLVFPEATRTEQGQEMAFHRIGFEIACRANVPVVPIVLRCKPSWLSKEQPLLRPPFGAPHMSLSKLEAIEPANFGNDSRRMRDHVLKLYQGELADS